MVARAEGIRERKPRRHPSLEITSLGKESGSMKASQARIADLWCRLIAPRADVALARPIPVLDVRSAVSSELGRTSTGYAARAGLTARNAGQKRPSN
jgi:hypothetical protein